MLQTLAAIGLVNAGIICLPPQTVKAGILTAIPAQHKILDSRNRRLCKEKV